MHDRTTVKTPVLSTYRIQFSPYFNFSHCRDIVEHLSKLGVTHLYASPILESVKGSVHGYDQTDFTRVRDEIGSEPGLRALSNALKDRSIGWIQDIVPNHMAMTPKTPMIFDILKKGQKSEFADFFDIDWHDKTIGEGKLSLPFLAKPLDRELKEGQIKLSFTDDIYLCYGPLRLPLSTESYQTVLGKDRARRMNKQNGNKSCSGNPEEPVSFSESPSKDGITATEISEKVELVNSRPDILENVLKQQFYVLTYWRDSNKKLNYRRFFAVNGLIGVRQEIPDNFERYHSKLFQLVGENVADGFRVDHIDGFKMPYEYLTKLRDRIGNAYLVVEKILEMDEYLPPEWPVDGTTGYDFLGHVNYLLVDNSSMDKIDSIYRRFSGEEASWEKLVRDIKLERMETLFYGSLEKISKVFREQIKFKQNGEGLTANGIKQSVMAILSNMPVYRTYLSPTNEREEDKALFESVISKAKELSPELRAELDAIRNSIIDHPEKNNFTEAIMLLQQYMPGVYAKAVEDRLFFSYNALISLNEVGSMTFYRAPSIEQFHKYCIKKCKSSPAGMNALSTHDTKMSEDIRARISVLSEMPQLWESKLNQWKKANAIYRKNSNGSQAPSPKEEYYIYQIALGSYPENGQNLPEYKDRLKSHLLKSIREAEENTSWDDPATDYEENYMSFIDSVLNEEENRKFSCDFSEFLKTISFHGALNSLSQKIIQLTAPGVPDTYQGTEVWNFNFVDPDNRRPVDFKRIAELLAEVTKVPDGIKPAMGFLESYSDGRIKLYVTWRLLTMRKEHPELFTSGDYIPLKTVGRFSENIVAFLRTSGNESLIVATSRLTTRLGFNKVPVGSDTWADTYIVIPEDARSEFGNKITGELVNLKYAEFPAGELFKIAPFAVLHGVKKSMGQQSST